MFKAFEYRLYPTRKQCGLLLRCLVESRHLYNEMLEASCSEYTTTGRFLSKYQLNQPVRGRGGEHVAATTVQTLVDPLDKMLRRHLFRKELGQRVGFGRFRGPNRWHSIQLRHYGKGRDAFLDIEGKRLRVPGKLGKAIEVKQHRPLEAVPKTAYLVLRAVRIHVCVSHGHVEDRDVNAVKSILRLGRSLQDRTWPVAACVS